MKNLTGKARYKKESNYIYNDESNYVFDIMQSGFSEYRLNLVGTPWEFMNGESRRTSTVTHGSHLIILELYQTMTLPLTEEETHQLVVYIKEDSTRTLQDFLDANSKPSAFPIIDLVKSDRVRE